jgi:hypothetical protein
MGIEGVVLVDGKLTGIVVLSRIAGCPGVDTVLLALRAVFAERAMR